jgi:hypothetical protein
MSPCTKATTQVFYIDLKSRIKSTAHNSWCIDYHVGAQDAKMWPCHNGRNQKWYFKSKMEVKTMKAMSSVATRSPIARNFYSGYDPTQCMEFTEPKGNVKMLPCTGFPGQLFYFSGSFNSRAIKSPKDPKKCMHYDWRSGTNVKMENCHNGQEQKYSFDGASLKSARDGKCVEYDKKTGNVYMNKCHAGTEQKWFDKVKKAVSADVMKAAPATWPSALNLHTDYVSKKGRLCLEQGIHNELLMAVCSYRSRQKFYISCGSGKTCDPTQAASLKSVKSRGNFCMQYGDSGTSMASILYIDHCGDGTNQKFYIDELGHLRMQGNDLCVDYHMTKGSVTMKSCHYGQNQKWSFMSKVKSEELQAMAHVPKLKEAATNFYTLYKDECMICEPEKDLLIMEPCQTAESAHFYFDGGTERLKSAKDPKKCAEPKVSDNIVVMVQCNDGDKQKFVFDKAKRLTSRAYTGKCLAYNKLSAKVRLAPCHGGDNQRWYYGNHTERLLKPLPETAEDARALIDRANKKCLDIDIERDMLYMSTCSFGRNSQRFYYVDNTLRSPAMPGLCTNFNEEDHKELNLYLNPCRSSSESQKFFFDMQRLRSDNRSNACMDYTTTGQLYMGDCDDARRTQLWHFEEDKPRANFDSIQELKKVATSCETEDPPEESRMYSSVYGGDALGTGHAQSRLSSKAAWSAQYSYAGEWMQIDVGKRKDIGGVVLLGRTKPNDWVTAYKVFTSMDGYGWSEIDGVFDGAADADTPVYGTFDPVAARYVRIMIETWEGHLSARAGVVVCRSVGETWMQQAGRTSMGASLLGCEEPTNQINVGCYVFASECPKLGISFRTWTRDHWGEKHKNASVDQDACLRMRKSDHNMLCGTTSVEMMFVPSQEKRVV